MKKEFYLKALDTGCTSPHQFLDAEGSSVWQKPVSLKSGAWKPACDTHNKTLRPHYWGYHLAKLDHAASWFHQENFLAEAGEEVVEGWDCVVTNRARLVRYLPMTDKDWMRLTLNYAHEVHTLLDLMEFPDDMAKVVRRAFEEVEKWNTGADNHITAYNYCIQASVIAGRNIVDSRRSYQYMANSDAAANTAMCMADLIYLSRPDGQRLVDMVPAENPTSRAMQRGALKRLWLEAQSKPALMEKNVDVCRRVCAHAAKAVEAAVRQLEMLASINTGTHAPVRVHTLSPLLERWVTNSVLPESSPMSHHALSGVRGIQNQSLLLAFGL